jgi:hypothetical protein
MFDLLRNLTKSVEEKQQEALNAYLDDALSPQERRQFEQQLTRDADLRREVEQRRALQTQMRQMPRRRVPRNFTLDPAVYGRPQRQPLFQLYPVMRTAAVLTAIFFILAIGADLFLAGQSNLAVSSSAPQGVAMATEEVTTEMAMEAPLAAQAVEVTTEDEIATESAAADTAVSENVTEAPAAETMEEAAAEGAALAEGSPAPQTEADTFMTTETAEAGGEAPQALVAATPPATMTAPATAAATKSTAPRPETEPAAGERALTAMPTATAVPQVPATPTTAPVSGPAREPISGLRLLQIGLGVLLILLLTAVFYVRRQTF